MPLKDVDENELVQTYQRRIANIAYRYCISRGFDFNQYRDDILSEAAIAFINACRMMKISSPTLSAFEYGVVKNKIRIAVHRAVNEILYGTPYPKNLSNSDIALCFSDVIREAMPDDSGIVKGRDDDLSHVYVEQFFNTLNKHSREIVQLRMDGWTFDAIGSALNKNGNDIHAELRRIGSRYRREAYKNFGKVSIRRAG